MAYYSQGDTPFESKTYVSNDYPRYSPDYSAYLVSGYFPASLACVWDCSDSDVAGEGVIFSNFDNSAIKLLTSAQGREAK